MSKILNFLKGLLHSNSNENHERAQWDSNAEYYLCTLGYAVGFGSLWRFPYLLYENGGGASLIPYFIFVFILAFPLFYMETAIGQSFKTSVTGCFEKVSKKFKGVGLSELIITFFMGSYYNLLMAYAIIFFVKSFSWPLPWKVEDPDETGALWNPEYFKHDILNLTSGISELGSINVPILLASLTSFFICYLCIAKGLKMTGKVAYITSPAPYFFLIVFLFRGVFLDGAWDGIKFLFAVDWSKLFNLTTWYRAANQVLFQYSLATGTLFAFASYKESHQSLMKPAFIIPGITALTGILCGLTVFTYMGHMAKVAGVSLNELPLSGPDLVFVAYPAALTLMPGSTIWSILFFVMLFFLGIDTEFAFMETIAGYLEDEKIKIFGKDLRMEVSRIIIMLALFLAGFILNFDGGFHFLAFYDDYSTIVPMMVAALLECVVFGWVYGTDRIDRMILKNTGEKFPAYATICIKYIAIPILGILMIGSFIKLVFIDLFNYPWWGGLIGLTLMGMPISSIIYFYKKYKNEKIEIQEGDEAWIELTEPMNKFGSY